MNGGATAYDPPADPAFFRTTAAAQPDTFILRDPIAPYTREQWRREVTTLPDLQDPPPADIQADENYWMLRFNEQSRIDGVPTPTAEYTARVLCGFLRDLHLEYLHVSTNLGRDMLFLQDQIEDLRAAARAQEAYAPQIHTTRTVSRPQSRQLAETPRLARATPTRKTGAAIPAAANSLSPLQPRTPAAPSWAAVAQYSSGRGPATSPSPAQPATRRPANRSSPSTSAGSSSLDSPGVSRRFQLLVHNIPTSASLGEIHGELSRLNPAVKIYGAPIWLVKGPKREGKLASTVVITVDKENSSTQEMSGFDMKLNASIAVCVRCAAKGHLVSSCGKE